MANEIISKRSERNKTFDLGNGKFQLECHGAPIHFKNASNEWEDIDLTFRDGGLGNFISDKNKVSVGFRQDLKLEKYYGIRYDYDHQFEGTIKEIQLDGVGKITKTTADLIEKKPTNEISNKLNAEVEIINKLSRLSLKNFIKVSAPIGDFKIVEEVHLKGLTCSNRKEKNTYLADENNRFNFVDEKGELKLWINQPIFEDADGDMFKGIDHTLEEIDGHFIYTKVPTKEGKDDLVLATFPVLIDSSTYYSSTADGNIYSATDVSWATTRAYATGEGTSNNNTYLTDAMEAKYAAKTTAYTIWRSFFYFDTSDIGIGSTVTDAVFSLYGYGANYNGDVSVQKGTQADTLVVADFDSFSGNEYAHSGAWSVAGYNDLTLNATGESEIVKNGTTKLCARNYTYDYLNSAPGDAYIAGCYYSDDTSGTKDPKLVVTYTAAASDVSVSVADSTAVSDTKTIFITTRFLSVTDSTAVADSVSILRTSHNISVADSTTITDTKTLLIPTNYISVADSTTVADTKTIYQTSYNISVADSTVISDAVSIVVSGPKISVADSTAVTDTPTMSVSGPKISVADSTAVTDSVSISFPALGAISISVSDTTEVTESVTIYQNLYNISVIDSTAVADVPTILRPTDYISVADSTIVTDTAILTISSPQISVADSTAVSDTPTVAVSGPKISVADSTAVTDAITLYETSYKISVTDSTTVTDTPTLSLSGPKINVSDSTAVSESISVLLITPGAINVSDSTVVADVSTLQIPTNYISVADSTVVTDVPTLALAGPQISVSDSTAITDAPTITLGAEPDLILSVSDSITVTDTVILVLSDLTISVADSTLISESVSLLLSMKISVSDSTTISEVVTFVRVDTLHSGAIMRSKENIYAAGITNEKDNKMNSKGNQYPLPMDDKIIR